MISASIRLLSQFLSITDAMTKMITTKLPAAKITNKLLQTLFLTYVLLDRSTLLLQYPCMQKREGVTEEKVCEYFYDECNQVELITLLE